MYRWITRRVRMARLNLAILLMPRIAGADGAAEPPKEPAKKEEPPAKTFTQEDVDRIVQDRIARVKKDGPSEDEIENLRAAATRLAEIEEANKSDLEKAAATAHKAQEDAAAARAEADAAKQEANAIKRKSAIVSAAAEIGADPDIIFALLNAAEFKVTQGESNFEVMIGDDGQVTGAAQAVRAIAELKNIVGPNTPPGPGDGGTRTAVPPAGTLDEQIAEAEKAGDFKTARSLKSQKLALASAQ